MLKLGIDRRPVLGRCASAGLPLSNSLRPHAEQFRQFHLAQPKTTLEAIELPDEIGTSLFLRKVRIHEARHKCQCAECARAGDGFRMPPGMRRYGKESHGPTEVRGRGDPKLLPNLEGYGVTRIIVNTRPARSRRRDYSLVECDQEVRRHVFSRELLTDFPERPVYNVEGHLRIIVSDTRASARQQPSAGEVDDRALIGPRKNISNRTFQKHTHT
jgi:hypothetical protein